MTLKLTDPKKFAQLSLRHKIDALLAHWKHEPGSLLGLTNSWTLRLTVETTISSYFRALAYKATQDKVSERREILKAIMLSSGCSAEDNFQAKPGKGKSAGDVYLPSSFFDCFPEFRLIAEEYWAGESELIRRDKPVFNLSASKDMGSMISSRRKQRQFDFWPNKLNYAVASKTDETAELRKASRQEIANTIMDSILEQDPEKQRIASLDKESAKVLTFGSCFAQNLNRALQAKGINSQSLRLEEAINTTHANRLLIQSILDGECASELEGRVSTDNLDVLRSEVLAASVIVLTVGVSPVSEWVNSGKLCLAEKLKPLFTEGKIRQRFTSVDENKENLVAIVNLLNEFNPRCQIFITLSPVPLVGVADNSSVFKKDVISKSTLRLAIEQASEEVEFTYWPSFEVVKWMAPHVPLSSNYQAFGEDDMDSRHVSAWLIDTIVDKFIERVFTET